MYSVWKSCLNSFKLVSEINMVSKVNHVLQEKWHLAVGTSLAMSLVVTVSMSLGIKLSNTDFCYCLRKPSLEGNILRMTLKYS